MINTDSLLEIAIELLKSKKKPKKMKEIVREVMTRKGYSTEEAKEVTPQFYLDFMASGYFVYCGEDTWDLKYRQPVSMLDKDGGDYDLSGDDLDEVKANELKDDDYDYTEKSNENEQTEEEDNDDSDDDDLKDEFETNQEEDDDFEFDREFDPEEEENEE